MSEGNARHPSIIDPFVSERIGGIANQAPVRRTFRPPMKLSKTTLPSSSAEQ